eukprot:763281-Rhodomonas_salina.1
MTTRTLLLMMMIWMMTILATRTNDGHVGHDGSGDDGCGCGGCGGGGDDDDDDDDGDGGGGGGGGGGAAAAGGGGGGHDDGHDDGNGDAFGADGLMLCFDNARMRLTKPPLRQIKLHKPSLKHEPPHSSPHTVLA